MSSTNGSNPRLDRIEKILEQTARARKEADAANDEAHARFAKADAQLKNDLRRWAGLGVKEARNQRKRIAKLDRESAQYRRRTDQNLAEITDNLAEITDKLNGLIGYVPGR